MNLPRFSIAHPSLVWLFLLLFTGVGIHAYFTISQREDPEVKISIALVYTIWPGASNDKIERLVTNKLEDKFEELSELGELTSFTRDNLSVIMVKVDFETDTDIAWQKLRNKIEEVRPDLPDGIDGPHVMDDFGDVTAMILTLSSPTATPKELEDLADDLKGELRKVPSVGKIALLGVQQQAVYIEGSLESFSAYGFTPMKAATILNYQNVSLPAGYVRTPEKQYRMEPTGDFKLLTQIGNTVLDISPTTGHILKVEDVFDLRQAFKEPPSDYMRSDGDPSIGLDIRMKKGNNVVAMGREVMAVAREFEKRLPPNVKLIAPHDQPREVDHFIQDFMSNLYEGLVIVFLVMFLSMGLRSAGLISLALPLSIIVTIGMMPLFRVHLETVSIGAFIIALGMLVDNAIIITDNIYVHMEKGADRLTAACRGSQEMAVPALTGTLATVFAFMPLLLLKEETGSYVRSLPIVVSLSLMASWVLAMTVTPLASYKWLKVKKSSLPEGQMPRWQRAYHALLDGGLKHRFLVVMGAFLALAGSLVLLKAVGASFFPMAHRDQCYVDIWLPEGASLEETGRIAAAVENMVKDDPQVLHYVTYVGKGGPRFMMPIKPEFNTSNYAQLLILTTGAEVTPGLVERYNRRVRQEISGARVAFRRIFLGPPVAAPIALRLTGPDYGVMKELSLRMQAILRDIPGSQNVRDDMGEDVQSLRIDIDADAAISAGVTNTEVALGLLTAYEGLPVTTMRSGEDEIPVYLRLKAEERDMGQSLNSLRISSETTGSKVPLAAFATIEPSWSPGVVHHHSNRRSITVLSDTAPGVLTDSVLNKALPRIHKIALPQGYQMEVSGEQKERAKSFGQLIVVFILIITMLLLMLVIQFNSIKKALVILVSVPLAIIGAVLGLLFSGNSFSFMAFLGVVSLAGMVIKNAIVWVEFVDRAMDLGLDFRASVIDAGIKRMRPIMLATGTTVGGLVPLALFGGPLWEGMAWAMVLGLSLSTLLTLVVIPIIYYAVFRRRYAQGPSAGPEGLEDCMKKPSPAAGSVATALLLALALSPVLLVSASARAGDDHPVRGYMSAAGKNASQARSAQVDLEVARTQRMQAIGSFVPTGMAQVSATRLNKEMDFSLDTASLGLPIDIPPMTLANQNVYMASLKVQVPLFVGGMRFALLSAATHGVKARDLALQAVEEGVGFGAAASYVNVLQARLVDRVMAEAREVDRVMVEIARQRHLHQMGTAFDVSYAQTRLSDTRRKQVETKSALTQRIHELNSLSGLPLGSPVEMRDLCFDPDFEPDLPALLAAQQQRPQMKAMNEAVSAAGQQVKARQATMLPTFALLGEGGYKHGDLGYTGGDGYWQVTAAMQWNLGLDTVGWYRIRESRLQQEAVQVKREEAQRDMDLALSRAYEQFIQVREIFSVASQAVATAHEGLNNAHEAYRAGVLPLSTLVEAAKALVETKMGYVQAYYGRLLTELQLKYVGGMPLVSEANTRASDPMQSLNLPPLTIIVPTTLTTQEQEEGHE